MRGDRWICAWSLPLWISACGGADGTSHDSSQTDDTADEGDPSEDASDGNDSSDDGGETGDGTSEDGGESDDSGSSEGDDDGDGECGSIVTFETGKTPTAEIHVGPQGEDDPGCGPQASPCATIQYAGNLAIPGAAVRIHPGTYPGGSYLDQIQGTAAAPIWIGGVPGMQRPVVTGGGESLHLSRARYLIVHDLELTGSSQNGINADDGSLYDDPDAARHLIFRDLYIHDIGSGGNQDCLKLSGIDDYFVLDNEFSACGGGGSGSGVDHVGCHHGWIVGNDFHDNLDGGNAIQCKGGSDDIEIRANRIVDGGQRGVNLGGSTGFEFFRPPLSETDPNFEARNIRVIANDFRGSVTPVAFVGCVDCLVANNTIDTPDNWILRILQETTSEAPYEFLPASNGRFVNNLVYFSRGGLSTYVNIGPDTAPETFEFAHNLWYAYDAPDQSDPASDLPVTEEAGISGADPMLGDPQNGDYSIDAGSPAAYAGTPLSAVEADRDFACYSDPPSIGAHEVPE